MVEAHGQVQFFVRKVSGGQSIVVHGHSEDTVEFLHRKLEAMTGIPMAEQRLIYNGKQLQFNQSLVDCCIQKDAVLQLVCRMRSTRYPRAWQLTSEIAAYVSRLCATGVYYYQAQDYISSLIEEFLKLIPSESTECLEFFRVFITCSGPAALVRLYAAVHVPLKQCADFCIRCFLSNCKNHKNKCCKISCFPVILDFCKLLRQVVHQDDLLYRHCRSFLATTFGNLNCDCSTGWNDAIDLLNVSEIFFFFKEIAEELSEKMESMISNLLLVSMEDIIEDFSAFMKPLMSVIQAEIDRKIEVARTIPIHEAISQTSLMAEDIKELQYIYTGLLKRMNWSLGKLEGRLDYKGTRDSEVDCSHWSHHLILLKELNSLSMLYKDAEHEFWAIMKSRKTAICALVIRYANRDSDYQWILQHNEVTDFQSRRHLALMMFPEVKHEFEEQHEMLIDRSNLLSESLEYITGAGPDALHSGLFIEFKNEEATGPGVLREWFFAVIQAIFDERNSLFVACPNDRRRFYPNPATNVDTMHLKYYTFAGRVIALAMMHKIQLGLGFDRVFFLQLADVPITLDDIRDADPLLYSSCKQILEMDSEFVDSDALGLTFEREFDEFGVIKAVELCVDGKNKIVTSENREEYINLLIRHRFVTSISPQLANFAKGFADILSISGSHTLFFRSLDHNDLDRILHGNRSDVSVEDWQHHTDYCGFTVSDPQISWFWQVVKSMSAEQKHCLLFFWTSIKYLPFDGFCGLPSRLNIQQAGEPTRRLPSSHTCFFELCLPCYSSILLMRDALYLITEEHISHGFGTA